MMMRFTDGIVFVDDFFSPEAIADLKRGNYTEIAHHDERKSDIASREKTEIRCALADDELWTFMNGGALAHAIMDAADLSWRFAFNKLLAPENYAAISRYTPGGGMVWHCDHWHGQVLNWIVTLEGSNSYIKWTDEPFPEAKEIYRPTHVPDAMDLIPNRLILMPSYYPHTIIMDDDEPRVSIHGHFKNKLY
jgi:hypothetical protein